MHLSATESRLSTRARAHGALLFAAILVVAHAWADAPVFETELVFDPEQAMEPHGHVHASCIVECPNGDLRVVWYENGRELPEPYFNKQKDKSADVRIAGSRRQPAAEDWEPAFVMSDTFGVSDNNPCLLVDKQGRLWLFHSTLLGVPEWSWGSAILRFMSATNYAHPGRPTWETSNVLVVQADGPETVLDAAIALRKADGWPEDKLNEARQYIKMASGRLLAKRIGWMPRVHPLVRHDGAILLPLANENGGAACVAITDDAGKNWVFSKLVPDLGLSQPTLVEFPGGAITAFFRNDSGRIKRSDSADGGLTWGPVSKLDLPNPNSGIEALLLGSGKLLMVYNDSEKERGTLAASLSDDNGKTWKWTRHIEQSADGRFDYPSVVQGKDGAIHVSYSFATKAIKHARFNEAWVMERDK